jgi:hypothetical protein
MGLVIAGLAVIGWRVGAREPGQVSVGQMRLPNSALSLAFALSIIRSCAERLRA